MDLNFLMNPLTKLVSRSRTKLELGVWLVPSQRSIACSSHPLSIPSYYLYAFLLSPSLILIVFGGRALFGVNTYIISFLRDNHTFESQTLRPCLNDAAVKRTSGAITLHERVVIKSQSGLDCSLGPFNL